MGTDTHIQMGETNLFYLKSVECWDHMPSSQNEPGPSCQVTC